MTEQDLDDADVDAVLKQVGRKAMAQRVGTDPLGDPGCGRRLDNDAVQLPGAERLGGVLAGEQPALRVHDALLAPSLPPLAQQGEQVRREHGVAILTALAALDRKRCARPT